MSKIIPYHKTSWGHWNNYIAGLANSATGVGGKVQWRLLSTERPPSLSFKFLAAKRLFWKAVYLFNSSVLLNPIHLVAYKNPQSLICRPAAQPAPPHCTLLSLLFSFSLGYLARICSEFNLINYSPAPSYINVIYQRQWNELLLSIGQLFPHHTFDVSFQTSVVHIVEVLKKQSLSNEVSKYAV